MGQAWPSARPLELTVGQFTDILGTGFQRSFPQTVGSEQVARLHDERRRRIDTFLARGGQAPALTQSQLTELHATLDSDKRWKVATAASNSFQDAMQKLIKFFTPPSTQRPSWRPKLSPIAEDPSRGIRMFGEDMALYEIVRAVGFATNLRDDWADAAGVRRGAGLTVLAQNGQLVFNFASDQPTPLIFQTPLPPRLADERVDDMIRRWSAGFTGWVRSWPAAAIRHGLEWLSCSELWLLFHFYPSCTGPVLFSLMTERVAALTERVAALTERVAALNPTAIDSRTASVLLEARAPPWVPKETLSRVLVEVGLSFFSDRLAPPREAGLGFAWIVALESNRHLAPWSVPGANDGDDNDTPIDPVPDLRSLRRLPQVAELWMALIDQAPKLPEEAWRMGVPPELARRMRVPTFRCLMLLRLFFIPGLADAVFDLQLPDPFELGTNFLPREEWPSAFAALVNPSFESARRLLAKGLNDARQDTAASWIKVLASTTELEFRMQFQPFDISHAQWSPTPDFGSSQAAAVRSLALFTRIPLHSQPVPEKLVTILQEWRTTVDEHLPTRRPLMLWVDWLTLSSQDDQDNDQNLLGIWATRLQTVPSVALTTAALQAFLLLPSPYLSLWRRSVLQLAALLVLRSRNVLSNAAFVQAWADVAVRDFRERLFAPSSVPVEDIFAPNARLAEQFAGWKTTTERLHWTTASVMLALRCNPLGQRSNPLGQRSNPLGQQSLDAHLLHAIRTVGQARKGVKEREATVAWMLNWSARWLNPPLNRDTIQQLRRVATAAPSRTGGVDEVGEWGLHAVYEVCPTLTIDLDDAAMQDARFALATSAQYRRELLAQAHQLDRLQMVMADLQKALARRAAAAAELTAALRTLE